MKFMRIQEIWAKIHIIWVKAVLALICWTLGYPELLLCCCLTAG